jgi:hypothetical protein
LLPEPGDALVTRRCTGYQAMPLELDG